MEVEERQWSMPTELFYLNARALLMGMEWALQAPFSPLLERRPPVVAAASRSIVVQPDYTTWSSLLLVIGERHLFLATGASATGEAGMDFAQHSLRQQYAGREVIVGEMFPHHHWPTPTHFLWLLGKIATYNVDNLLDRLADLSRQPPTEEELFVLHTERFMVLDQARILAIKLVKREYPYRTMEEWAEKVNALLRETRRKVTFNGSINVEKDTVIELRRRLTAIVV
jgi:hypothetical protein